MNKYYAKKLIANRKLVKFDKYAQIKNDIKSFYLEDGNSTHAPGVRDFITRKRVRMSNRYLTASTDTLFKKYVSGSKISKSCFAKMKPFWVVQMETRSRETCMRFEHANYHFLLARVNYVKIKCFKNSGDLFNYIVCNQNSISCMFRKFNHCKDKKILYDGNVEDRI